LRVVKVLWEDDKKRSSLGEAEGAKRAVRPEGSWGRPFVAPSGYRPQGFGLGRPLFVFLSEAKDLRKRPFGLSASGLRLRGTKKKRAQGTKKRPSRRQGKSP